MTTATTPGRFATSAGQVRGPRRPVGAGRLSALDGLRGLAALVVVVHHAALTLPALAAQYQAPNPASRTFFLAYTPAHLLWAGGEAVLVFFVLSGLVLTRPMLAPRPLAGWLSYYPKRVVRLYVPVLAAVALTGAVLLAVPRIAAVGRSWWFNAHAGSPTAGGLLHDAFLLDGTGWANSALWSLRYEVLFSLFLPLFVVLVRGLTVPVWASAPFVLWGIGWAASIGHETLSYMFVFAAGALIAGRLEEIAGLVERFSVGAGQRDSRSTALWSLIGAVAVLLLLAEWWMKLFVANWTLWLPIGRPAGVLGAGLIIIVVLHCAPVRRAFEHRLLQWLGKISFSLYLTHEPLVVSVSAIWAPSAHRLPVTIAISVALSLGAAVLFFRTVERPSHRLANLTGVVAGDLARSALARRPERAAGHPAAGHRVPVHAAPSRAAPLHPVSALHDTVVLRPERTPSARPVPGQERRRPVRHLAVGASTGTR